MYAVIEDSGQQFRVSEGDVIDVDLRDMPDNVKSLEFDRVLLVSSDKGVKVGTPLVNKAKVVADVVNPLAKGEKVYIYYWRRRKSSRSKTGHRQKYVKVRITKIVA